MKGSLFYSLPPAGQKIPLQAIIRSFNPFNKNSGDIIIEHIKDYLGSKYLFFLNSGRAALWLILKALSKIDPQKKEVILPAYTCPAVASSVLKAGLKPVLCDNNINDFGFSTEDLERKINRNSLAVIVVHFFGYPANIEEVKVHCRKYDTYVVEDAAQAFGNSLINSPKTKLGLSGDAGFFSFGRGKPISIMHGGILTTNSEEIFHEVYKIYENLNHHVRFQSVKYAIKLGAYMAFSAPNMYWIPQKIPFLHLGETIFEREFDTSHGHDLGASLIVRMIESIEKEKEIRRENSRWYSLNLNHLPRVLKVQTGDFPYLRYPLLIGENSLRDQVLEKLTSQGTGAALFYPCPLNWQPGLKEILQDSNPYPNATKLSDTMITLPVHSGVTQSIRKKIEFTIRNAISNGLPE